MHFKTLKSPMPKMLTLLFLLLTAFAAPAHSESLLKPLKELVNKLEFLPLHYGANTLRIHDRDVLITRGEYRNDDPWGGDIYSVIVKEPDSWLNRIFPCG